MTRKEASARLDALLELARASGRAHENIRPSAISHAWREQEKLCEDELAKARARFLNDIFSGRLEDE